MVIYARQLDRGLAFYRDHLILGQNEIEPRVAFRCRHGGNFLRREGDAHGGHSLSERKRAIVMS